jgi:hypothetical protein
MGKSKVGLQQALPEAQILQKGLLRNTRLGVSAKGSFVIHKVFRHNLSTVSERVRALFCMTRIPDTFFSKGTARLVAAPYMVGLVM